MDQYALANAHIAARASLAGQDPERPRCHLAPASGWMNDPNGTIRYGGWYHVFFQHHPFGDQWAAMHWGHARSRNLAHWELLPIALAPAIDQGEEHCYSGCIALDAADTPRLFYTSVSFPRSGGAAGPGPQGRIFGQWRATAMDGELISWRRDRCPAIGAGLTHPEARDPFFFRWRGRSFMVVGDGLRVPLYECVDESLDHWVERGVLFASRSEFVPFCECPNLLPLGDPNGEDWLLLLSPFRAVEWRRGRFDGAAFTVTASGRLDHHDHFYATNTLTDEAGRTVVLGWIRGFPAGRGWNGCLAHPRLVHADGDGIRQEPHPAVELLRHGAAVRWAGRLEEELILAAHAGDALDVSLNADGPVALRLAGHLIVWTGAVLLVGGQALPLPGYGLDLRVLIDGSVIEVFADEGRCVLTRTVVGRTHEDQAVIIPERPGVTVTAELHRLASCT